jgi:hypothetical protein
MSSLNRELAHRANRYQSLRNFYLADARRRRSPESDVGLWWRIGARGPVYRAAWVHATGELYVTPLGRRDGSSEVVVLARAEDRRQLEDVLRGWQDVCPQPDSMTWLQHRAASLAAPEKPARSFAHAFTSQPDRREGARVSRPRRGAAPRSSSRTFAERPARGSVRQKAGAVSSTVAAEHGVSRHRVTVLGLVLEM